MSYICSPFAFCMDNRKKAILAVCFLCIAWGTTFIAIKIGLSSSPPFFFAATRQVIAGILLLLLAFMNKTPFDVSRKNVLIQAFVGACLVAGGNGLVTYGVQYIPSGLAAVICSTSPIFSVLLSLLFVKGERVNPLIITGMILGLLGVAFNFKDSFSSVNFDQWYLIGISIVIGAAILWSIGSLVGKQHRTSGNSYFNSSVQVLTGGIILQIVSLTSEDLSSLSVTTNMVGALTYLIIVGSVLGFTAYTFALKHLPIGNVMIYAYVNPIVAVILGTLIYQEPLTMTSIIAFTLILIGIFLVNFGYARLNKKR